MEVGHFGPKIEAEKDKTLSQYLQNVVRRHQFSLWDLRHLRFRPSRHPRYKKVNLSKLRTYIALIEIFFEWFAMEYLN